MSNTQSYLVAHASLLRKENEKKAHINNKNLDADAKTNKTRTNNNKKNNNKPRRMKKKIECIFNSQSYIVQMNAQYSKFQHYGIEYMTVHRWCLGLFFSRFQSSFYFSIYFINVNQLGNLISKIKIKIYTTQQKNKKKTYETKVIADVWCTNNCYWSIGRCIKHVLKPNKYNKKKKKWNIYSIFVVVIV